MRLTLARAAFAHRTLWRRDETYRIAFVLGPPVLLGGLIGAAVWFALQARTAPLPNAAWAVPNPGNTGQAAAAPLVIMPSFPLPRIGSDGKPAGLEPGWTGMLYRAEATPKTATILDAARIGPYEPGVDAADMAAIVAAGPKTGLYAGIQEGLLRIDEGGVYGITLRLQRNTYAMADCVMRLGIVDKAVLRQDRLNIAGLTDITYEPVLLALQPGLYRTVTAFACWNNGSMSDTGRLSLLMRAPGQTVPTPVRNKLYRPLPGAIKP